MTMKDVMEVNMEDIMKGVGRPEAKKIVEELEKKAMANGWNPKGPYSDMETDGKLTKDEIFRYHASIAILKGTVDLDEGAVHSLGGTAYLMKQLDEARKCASSNALGITDRFERIVNTLALKLLVEAEKAIVPEKRKFAVHAKVPTQGVKDEIFEVEARNVDEATVKAADILDERGEHASEIEVTEA